MVFNTQTDRIDNVAMGDMMARGISIDLRKWLVPLSLFTMFVLWTQFQAPLWLLAIFTMWIPLYYVAYPALLRKRWQAFEKEFAIKFQQGKHQELLEFYREQWFLRKFGPRAEMLNKLSLIYSSMEKFREAEQVLERSINLTEPQFRDRLYFNLANVKYELGKYDEAEQMYKALRKGSPYLHSVQTQLALIDLHRGQRVDEARTFLEKNRNNVSGVARDRIEQALQASA